MSAGAAMAELVLTSPAAHPPGESDEFYTLSRDFNPWNEEFRFTVDCCALNAEAAKLPRFYTPEQNAFDQDYRAERVWCNNPYSDIWPWAALADHWMRNGAQLWVCLWPQNRQDQHWWHEFIEPYRDVERDQIRNTRGRIGRGLSGRRFTIRTRNILGRRRFGFPGSPDSAGGGESPRTGHLLVIWRAA